MDIALRINIAMPYWNRAPRRRSIEAGKNPVARAGSSINRK
jgi:hypothetical protein